MKFLVIGGADLPAAWLERDGRDGEAAVMVASGDVPKPGEAPPQGDRVNYRDALMASLPCTLASGPSMPCGAPCSGTSPD